MRRNHDAAIRRAGRVPSSASRRVSIAWVGFLAIMSMLVFAGCATGPAGPTERPLYYGYGSGSSVTAALNSAKQDVLRQVVPDLIGAASAAANRETLERQIYASETVNAFFYLDTMETVSQGRQGDAAFYQIGIRVNLDALARSLRANGVFGDQVTPSASDELALRDRSPVAHTSSTASAPTQTASNAGGGASSGGGAIPEGLTPEEREIIDSYIESLTFLVYFDDDAPEDPFVMKAAIGMANGYLASERRSVIDLETVEALKADQELVYEEQTGRSVGIIQWIAQKLNADVYAELDARTTGETTGGKHYGQANLTMKFFESSTGLLLASVNYKSPRTFSQSSELDAVTNALQSSVYEVMPLAIEQLEMALRRQAAEGIPYQLVLQNSADARTIRGFAGKLEPRVEDLDTMSQTAEETVFSVRFLGESEDLMDLVFDLADGIPAFAGIELVLLRGRSLIFDTGM